LNQTSVNHCKPFVTMSKCTMRQCAFGQRLAGMQLCIIRVRPSVMEAGVRGWIDRKATSTRDKQGCMQANRRLQVAEAELLELKKMIQEAAGEMQELRSQNQAMRSCLLQSSTVLNASTGPHEKAGSPLEAAGSPP
jgi:hypothetical protein